MEFIYWNLWLMRFIVNNDQHIFGAICGSCIFVVGVCVCMCPYQIYPFNYNNNNVLSTSNHWYKTWQLQCLIQFFIGCAIVAELRKMHHVHSARFLRSYHQTNQIPRLKSYFVWVYNALQIALMKARVDFALFHARFRILYL